MDYSVVIPSYNCADYIAVAIRSAFAQSVPPRDIIVVDDGSNDDTEERLCEFNDDDRVVYIKQKNKGVSFARNKAIAYSSSDLIAFLDADDYWHPEKMEKQLSLFRKNIGLVYSLRQCFDDAGLVDTDDKYHLASENIIEKLLETNFICTSSAVVRRDCLLDVGLFNRDLSQGEDRDLWLRIAAAGYDFSFAKEALVYYRLGGSASNLKNIDKRYCDNKSSMDELFAKDKCHEVFSFNTRRKAWAALWRKYAYCLYEKGDDFKSFQYSFISLLFSPFNKSCVKIFCKSMIPRRFVGVSREVFNILSSILSPRVKK